MQKKTVPLILVTAVAVFLVLSFTLPAEAANWQQVTTISGSDSQTTSEFMVSGSEWRIRWSYTPDAQFPSLTAFSFFVYPHGETAAYVGHVVEYGSSETSGTLDFHDGTWTPLCRSSRCEHTRIHAQRRIRHAKRDERQLNRRNSRASHRHPNSPDSDNLVHGEKKSQETETSNRVSTAAPSTLRAVDR